MTALEAVGIGATVWAALVVGLALYQLSAVDPPDLSRAVAAGAASGVGRAGCQVSALVLVDPVKAAASDFEIKRWRVARDAGRRWFADLARHDRQQAWAIYDDGFDWRDWFDDKPAPGFKAGVESAADDVDGWAL